MLEKMVVLLQQSVPPIYATCFLKKYSMKLRLLSRTWPNFKIGTHSLDPQTQYVHSCSGETIGSCKLERMKTPNGQCTKRCRWLKVIKTKKKNLGKTKRTQFSESLGWDPPLPKSLEILFMFVFLFVFQGFYQVWGASRKLAWITGKAVKVPLRVQ